MSTITEGYLDAPVFKLVSDVAADLGVRAFVIGGYVRDCFLGRPNTDIDIVVEGSGIALAKAVAERVKTNVSVFKNFGTAMLHYKGIEVEFVGARISVTASLVMSVTLLVSTAKPVLPSAIELAQIISACFLSSLAREFSIKFSVSIENPTNVWPTFLCSPSQPRMS